MTAENQRKWLVNALKFTAPALAIFFFQLSQGVDIKVAGGLAIFAFYGLIADLLKKMK